ncbi:MAG: lysophospholipid acyltransferase family protein [Oligoflexus sp.]
MLTRKHTVSLKIQRTLAYFNMIWFVPLFMLILSWLGRYRCCNLQEIRDAVRKLEQENLQRPILICANHLTMIDSLLIIWFLYDFPTYLKTFRRFPWNVPELQNFGKNPLLRLMCYLGKCIYVERSGSLETKKLTLSKLAYLLDEGESLCIFPEGGRSRTGRINRDGAVYGVGQLIQTHPQIKVWCLYMRGLGQEQYSFFPKRGESFHLSLEMIEPQTTHTGRRADRDLTMQVMDQLVKMEDAFWHDRQRYRRHG